MTLTALRSPSARARRAIVVLAIGAWFVLYLWRALAGHWSLGSNAFDLSVFDYAFWNIGQGRGGAVPFLGQSIFSQHAMPVLYVLYPVYAIFPSATFLVVFVIAATAVAAVACYVICRRMGLGWLASLGIALVFLLARRTHSALAASFYPECLQAGLSFLVVALWRRRAMGLGVVVLLLLMTKEDAGIYLAGFAAVSVFLWPDFRRRAFVVGAASITWACVAVFVAIPVSRRAGGLPPDNPLLASRFEATPGTVSAGVLASRVLGRKSAETVFNLLATGGLLPLAGAPWLAVAAPGIVINLAADPASMQSSLIDHYAWPVLPWLFLATAAGAVRIERRWPRLAAVWIGLLLVATAIDNPALQRAGSTRIDPAAREVLQHLPSTAGLTVLAQPNLIPHLEHTARMFALGGDVAPQEPPDLVLLTRTGNLWPLTESEVASLIEHFEADERYVAAHTGALYVFRLRHRERRVPEGEAPPGPRRAPAAPRSRG